MIKTEIKLPKDLCKHPKTFIEESGSVNIPIYLEPKIKLALEGYRFRFVPINWFARLFWKWISVDLEIKDPPTLRDLLPRTIPRDAYRTKSFIDKAVKTVIKKEAKKCGKNLRNLRRGSSAKKKKK